MLDAGEDILRLDVLDAGEDILRLGDIRAMKAKIITFSGKKTIIQLSDFGSH